MTPETWSRVEALFHQAMEMPPEERAAFLDSLEAPNVAAAVKRLIDAAGTSDVELSRSVDQVAAAVGEMQAGPYRLLKEIGSGGMGTVFLAERSDDAFRKHVAVKFLRHGLDRDRFLAERQILASLDHPYIARLIDGGSTGRGEPYIVMDLVEGEPIDQHARGMRTSNRIRLFMKVLEAVSHAHQKLIVHRDLKPANILVTADGSPRLLDFGVARLLGDAPSLSTAITPEFASPELLEGKPVTTATDVYALGATLYQMFTGRPPREFQRKSIVEIVRAVMETPVAPAGPEVPKDLERIMLKAMATEPADRYLSVEHLAEDLRRFLGGRPVEARQGGWLYRASKHLKRNWVGLGVAAVLLGASAVSIHSARQANERFEQVRRLAQRSIFDFHDAIKDVPGTLGPRKQMVATAREYLDALALSRPRDTELLRDIATAYERVGDLQGNPYFANLGDLPGSLDSYSKALETRARMRVQDRAELVSCRAKKADVMGAMGDRDGSRKELESALAEAAEGAQTEALRMARARLHARLADQLMRAGTMAPAIVHFSRSRDLLESLPRGPDTRQNIIRTLRLEARGHYLSGATAKALELQKRALDEGSQLSAQVPANKSYQRTVMLIHNQLADTYTRLNQFDATLAHHQEAVTLGERLARGDPENVQSQTDLAFVLGGYANELQRRKRTGEALAACERAIRAVEPFAREKPSNTPVQLNLASYLLQLGDLRVQSDGWERGVAEINRGLALITSVRARDAASRDAVYYGYQGHEALAKAYERVRRGAESRRHRDLAVALLDGYLKEHPDNPDFITARKRLAAR